MVKKLPKIINQEEFEILLKSVDKTKRINAKRKKEYKVAMLLGFEAGMRISEIVGLRVDGEWKIKPLMPEMIGESSIKVLGKGGKERVVPRPRRLNDVALKMFPLKIKRRALQFFITKIGFDALHKPVSFHTLRHGFGSHLAGNGVPLHQVQMMMGHSRLDTTGIYLHANPKEAISNAQELF